ncbi:MAG: hypothetical protein IJG64_03800 [Oscillospiraceae bacterium]|nr:hypothetical protein [Oscillospiraceae bacterium]
MKRRMYRRTVRELLEKSGPVREELVELWLMQKFSLTHERSARAIHSLKRDRIIHAREGYLKLEADEETDRMAAMRSKALRVVLKFRPSGFVFERSGFPFMFSFVHEGLMVQVAYIMRGSEAADSLLMCSEAPDEADRQFVRRIAVMEDPRVVSLVRRCGITIFCTVNDEMEARVLSRRDSEKAWDDAA